MNPQYCGALGNAGVGLLFGAVAVLVFAAVLLGVVVALAILRGVSS